MPSPLKASSPMSLVIPQTSLHGTEEEKVRDFHHTRYVHSLTSIIGNYSSIINEGGYTVHARQDKIEKIASHVEKVVEDELKYVLSELKEALE